MGQPTWGSAPAPGWSWDLPPATWGAPPGSGATYAPVGPRPGPRRPNPLRLVLLAAIGLALGALAGLVLVTALARPPQTAYANDDYAVPAPETSPPEIPVPASLEQARTWMSANAVYGQSAPAPVRCEVPAIDVATADDATLDAHFEALVACLVRVWQPPLTAAGFRITRPSVTIYNEQVTTRCGSGKLPRNAFYCPADQQIYWSNTIGAILRPYAENPRAGDQVMAHEFGHAVQGRTGIIAASTWARKATSDDRERLELSRRTELQADCLSGVFLRSVSVSLGLQQADVDRIQSSYYAAGDDVLSGDPGIDGGHGRGESRRYWGVTGLGHSELARCATFTAPTVQVR